MTAEQGLEGGGISTGLWGGGRGIARPQVGAPMLRERESGGGGWAAEEVQVRERRPGGAGQL